MTRAFTTATDSSLINLIQGARARLALIAPALTTPVARALAARMADLPALSLTVILDADAEVYRMGYGDPEALEIIRNASKEAMFAGHVRSVRVVVDPPVFDDLACLVEVCEEVLVEALVTQAAVEALHKAVLHRLAGRNVVPFDTAVLLPSQHSV